MAKYRVFYHKNPSFMSDKNLTKEQVLEQEKHGYLLSISANDLEHLYSMMQAENWSPNGEGRRYVEQAGVRHTSMSVGDCAMDSDTGKVYECASVGWREVE